MPRQSLQYPSFEAVDDSDGIVVKQREGARTKKMKPIISAESMLSTLYQSAVTEQDASLLHPFPSFFAQACHHQLL